MTKIAYKQLCYMPLTPHLKRLFILKKTAMHMRWHKEGEHENNNVMVHPSDGEAWKVSITLTQTLSGMPEMIASG
jgi:hypothetical protein